MSLYILLSIIVSTLFFFISNEDCNGWYHVAMSLLVAVLFLLRLVPLHRSGYLKHAATVSTAVTLFLISSLFVPLSRHGMVLVSAVFFHELIFLILSLRFTNLIKAFVILTLGALLASALLTGPDWQAGGKEVTNWICVCLNMFLVVTAVILTYSNVSMNYLKPDKIFIPLLLLAGFFFFIFSAANFDGTANRAFICIAFSLLACSSLYVFLMLMYSIFRSDDREKEPIRFSSAERRKYQVLKAKLQWVRLKRRCAEPKEPGAIRRQDQRM